MNIKFISVPKILKFVHMRDVPKVHGRCIIKKKKKTHGLQKFGAPK